MSQKISLKYLFIIFLLLKCSLSFTQNIAKIEAHFDNLQNSVALQNGYLSLALKNCKTGNYLITKNYTKALKPASTMKLITTATALGLLGENYRFNTELLYCGHINNETLYGDIIIKGAGDPSLGHKRYETNTNYEALMTKWAMAIKNLGIKHINGNIEVDQSIFSGNSMPDSWQWGDAGNYYGAGSFGFNINENLYTAFFNSTKKDGETTKILNIFPESTIYNIDNKVVGLKSTNGDKVLFYNSPLSQNIIAQGSIPTGRHAFSVKGSIPNPAALTINMLGIALNKIGVGLTIMKTENPSSQNQLIIQEKSPSLFEICMQTNFESINLNAECLMKTIGGKVYGIGNDENGTKAIREYWESQGVDLTGFDNRDGSGLSASNYITTKNLTDILEAASKSNYFTAFYQSIAVVGEDGTLKNFAKNTNAVGTARVKSGTIDKVKAFAGYFVAKNGDLMAFSMIANQFEGGGAAMSRELGNLLGVMVE